MNDRSHLNTTLLAVLACLLWSTAFVGIKIGLAYTTPLNFAGLRFFIAGAMVIPFAGGPRALKATLFRHVRFIVTVSLLSTVFVYAFFYLGISLGTASTTAIVVGSGPLFVAVMAHLAMPNDKLTIRKSVSLLLGISGIAAIALSRYGDTDADSRALLSVFLLILANISGGIGNILIAKSERDISPLVLSALQLVLGGVLLFILSLFAEPVDVSIKPLSYYGALTYLSGLSAGAMTIWFIVLTRPGVKVSEINIWKFLIPVSGAILSWTLLDNDSPDTGQIIGMTAIAASLVLMHLRLSSKAPH